MKRLAAPCPLRSLRWLRENPPLPVPVGVPLLVVAPFEELPPPDVANVALTGGLPGHGHPAEAGARPVVHAGRPPRGWPGPRQTSGGGWRR